MVGVKGAPSKQSLLRDYIPSPKAKKHLCLKGKLNSSLHRYKFCPFPPEAIASFAKSSTMHTTYNAVCAIVGKIKYGLPPIELLSCQTRR